MELKNPIDFSRIEAVILDMDGVLVDTEPIHAESFRIFLRQLQIDFNEEFINDLVGYSIDHNIETINRVYLKDNPLEISAGVRQRDEIYLSMIRRRNLTTMEGVDALITLSRQRGWRLALASSSVRDQVDSILENLSINNTAHINYSDVFEVTVSGDEVENKKPAPDIYERALKSLNISAENCFTIEDSRAGIISAKANKITCFALQNQYLKPDQTDGADYVIRSINEVVQILNP